MFKFFKKKISEAVDKFSKQAEEEGEDIKLEDEIQEDLQNSNAKESKKNKDLESNNKELESGKLTSDLKDESKVKSKDDLDKLSVNVKEDLDNLEKKSEEKPKKGFLSRIFGRKKEEEPEEPEDKKEEEPEDKKEEEPEKPETKVKDQKKELISEEKEEPKEEEKSKEKTEEEKEEEPEESETKVKDQKKELISEEEPEEEKEEEPEKLETKVKDQKKELISEEEPEEEKGGFFSRLTKTFTYKKISKEKFEDLFWDLELTMLENNVAVEVIEKIKEDLSIKIVDKPLPRNKISSLIMTGLSDSIKSLFEIDSFNIIDKINNKKPYIICFMGINGSGKTTTIAKFVRLLQKNNKSVVLAAGDTFRAAAIDQLQLHADKLGVKMIRHDYGSDSAAVAFDAVKHAEAKAKDVVLIDTAGRIHSNKNLMDELKKVIRIAKPDLNIFIGESITGNDCVEQAKEFNDAVGIDAIILSKADIDDKGGAAISVSYVTQKPIIYLGTGQEYDDLQSFDKDKLMKDLGLI